MGKIPTPGMSDSVVKYSLGYLRPYHREIARRLVLGQKASDICRDLGMSVSRMSIIVNSPLFKRELTKLEQLRDAGTVDVTKTLRELSPVALETIERTMYQAESHRLRFDAAESILDRAGFGRITKQDINVGMKGDSSNYTDEELKLLVLERIERLKQEAQQREAELAEAETITVEFEEVKEGDNGGNELPD